jgi:hypothetical protein
MPSQTRKKGQARSPKSLGDLEWLRDRKLMLGRAHSFEGDEISDEEFYKFFEEMGEVLPGSKNRSRSRNRGKTKNKKSPKKRR